MKYKIYKDMKPTTRSLLAGALLLLSACSSDVDELTPAADDGRTLHTAILRFEGDIQHFDAPATRATTADWDDGATLYLQYQTTSGLVDGTAVYSQSKDEWTVNYYGTVTKGQQAKCEVYYFEKPTSTAMTSVSLNAQSAVFADNQATYLYGDGTITLRAHLKPQTGRLRFRGTSGYQFSFTGLKWYSGYNISANTLSQQSGQLTLTVGQDGYTPYVYGVFADAATRQLSVESGEEDFTLVKTFDASVFNQGKSGYINVPTMQSRNGWQLVEATEKTFTVSGVTFKMVKVKAGTFQMGGTESDEKPVHIVTLSKNYYIAETETTNALWYAIMGSKPTGQKNDGNTYPVSAVLWNDIAGSGGFIEKLNAATGKAFRLPTEAEWEYAARGGQKQSTPNFTYAGSNTISEVAWYHDNSNSTTHPVGQKKANELGLYDMSGNVWEWCADWYGSSYYSNSPSTDPTGPSSGSYRVNRGGSWYDSATYCRVANRSYDSPSNRSYFLGFRLAL